MSVWLCFRVNYVKCPFLHSVYGFGQIGRNILPDRQPTREFWKPNAFKGEGHSRKCIFLFNAKKPFTKLSHPSKFQLWKCRFSLWNSSPKQPKIWTLLPPLWTVLSSQAPLSWHYSVQDILSKWLPTSLLTTTAILFWAKHAPNSQMKALKMMKWIIAWKKNRFCWPCEGCQVSCSFVCFPPISSWTEWCHISIF